MATAIFKCIAPEFLKKKKNSRMRDDQMHASNVRIFIESGKAPDEKGKTIQNAKYKKSIVYQSLCCG